MAKAEFKYEQARVLGEVERKSSKLRIALIPVVFGDGTEETWLDIRRIQIFEGNEKPGKGIILKPDEISPLIEALGTVLIGGPPSE